MSDLAAERLRRWFLAFGRDLPWRDAPSPYAVWISEVMLQQTQVSVVLPYFVRWMEQFPDVQALAKAPIDQVIKYWEGLGYYSRARNLHKGAAYLCQVHGGRLPSDGEALAKVPGIGPYTVGAILSFAFQQKAAAVDGNVLRVMTRFWGISADIGKASTVNSIRQRVTDWLPEESPQQVMEGVIELGALVCKKRDPDCAHCPLYSGCVAGQSGRPETYPVKEKRTIYEQLHHAVLVISHADSYLVYRGEPGKVMADLYQFPSFDTQSTGPTHGELRRWLSERGILAEIGGEIGRVKAAFTRYRVTLYPFVVRLSSMQPIADGHWVAHEHLSKLPFSSGHRRILHLVTGR